MTGDLPMIQVRTGPTTTRGVYVYWQRGGWAVCSERMNAPVDGICFRIVSANGMTVSDGWVERPVIRPLRVAIAGALVLYAWCPDGNWSGLAPSEVTRQVSEAMVSEGDRLKRLREESCCF